MRPGKFYNQLTGKIASLSLLLSGLAYTGTAAVTVTPGGNGTGICSRLALTGSLPTYTTLDPIVITEGLVTDFQIGVGNSFILQAPSGWQFNPTGAPVVAVTGGDITGTPTAVVSTDGSQITVTFDVSTDVNSDQMQISGVEVIAATTTSGTGDITAVDPLTPPIPGITGGITSFGTVSLANDFAAFVLTMPSVCPGSTTADISTTAPAIAAGNYAINWDPAAIADGFSNEGPNAFPTGTSLFPVAVSATAVPGTMYNGTITFTDNNTPACSERTMPITVTIYSTPTVDPTTDVIACNGDAFAGITFTGAASTFNWNAYSTSFTLITSGTAGLPAGTATNTTPNPDTTIYVVTPMDNGCSGPTDTFLFVVNPTPHLDVTPGTTACAGQAFTFTNSSLTAGTTYGWERVTVNTDNPSFAFGSGNITETLHNNTTAQTFITYNDTLKANGCSFVETVIVTVNPLPVFDGSLAPASTCSGDPLTLTLSSTVPGTTFSWSRSADAYNSMNSGTADIVENLVNLGTTALPVTYFDTMNVNGCLYPHTLTATVNPIPVMTSATTTATCDSANFVHTLTSNLDPLTTFAWARPGASGTGNISDYLDNTTGLVEIVTYTITMTAGSCTSTALLNVSVNPMPALTSPASAGTCSGAVFTYTATASLPGTTFAWSRAAVTGVTPAIGSGTTATISETLVNTTGTAKVVQYIYTLTATGGCPNTDTVKVTVSPIPSLTSTKNPTPICDSTLFTYTPAPASATFNWYRRYVPGVVSLSVTGTGNISEYLDNSTYVPVPVAYVFTITAGGCSAVDSIHVTVNPTPILSTHKTDSACSGIPYNYSPLAGSSLVTFAWSRASVGGITPTIASGTGNISETLTNNNASATNVVYTYTLSIAAGSAACTNTQKLNVKVNPFIGAPSITLKSESSLCAGTAYQNFGTGSGQPAGIKYAWSAKNANVMATGADRQYALVSFPNAGTAVVYINTTSNATGCIGRDSATVTVSGSTAQNPGVIYTGGQLIALQNDVDTYQWGYDEKSTLKPNDITGEINQNYFISSLDNTKYYWVKTTKSGCTQKSYLVKPTGIEDITTEIGLKLYPNPASQFVTVEVNTADYNNITLEVFNMLGQQMRAGVEASASNQINVAALPAGVYMVDCVQNGVKVASARFIKN